MTLRPGRVRAAVRRLGSRRTANDRAERIARRFHEVYETLAPAHGYETRTASAVPWSDVPEANRSLMIATAAALLREGTITAGPNLPSAPRL